MWGGWPSTCRWPGWGPSVLSSWWGMDYLDSKAPSAAPPTKDRGAGAWRAPGWGTDTGRGVPELPELLRLTSCTGGASGFLNSDKEMGKENLARTDGRS